MGGAFLRSVTQKCSHSLPGRATGQTPKKSCGSNSKGVVGSVNYYNGNDQRHEYTALLITERGLCRCRVRDLDLHPTLRIVSPYVQRVLDRNFNSLIRINR